MFVIKADQLKSSNMNAHGEVGKALEETPHLDPGYHLCRGVTKA
jgi:hypothetical protein